MSTIFEGPYRAFILNMRGVVNFKLNLKWYNLDGIRKKEEYYKGGRKETRGQEVFGSIGGTIVEEKEGFYHLEELRCRMPVEKGGRCVKEMKGLIRERKGRKRGTTRKMVVEVVVAIVHLESIRHEGNS